MTLILSCITKGEEQIRATLDRLLRAGISGQAIIVIHPGEATGREAASLRPQHPAAAGHDGGTAGTVVSTAASASAAGGMVGWLMGFGVLALPGAVLGGAIGAVAGAAIGAARPATEPRLPVEVRHHYANRVVDDHVAILVQVEDFRQYEAVLSIFLDSGCQHILTTRNDPALAEADQIGVIAEHPVSLTPARQQSFGERAGALKPIQAHDSRPPVP